MGLQESPIAPHKKSNNCKLSSGELIRKQLLKALNTLDNLTCNLEKVDCLLAQDEA